MTRREVVLSLFSPIGGCVASVFLGRVNRVGYYRGFSVERITEREVYERFGLKGGRNDGSTYYVAYRTRNLYKFHNGTKKIAVVTRSPQHLSMLNDVPYDRWCRLKHANCMSIVRKIIDQNYAVLA